MTQLSERFDLASLWKCLGVGITTKIQTMKACGLLWCSLHIKETQPDQKVIYLMIYICVKVSPSQPIVVILDWILEATNGPHQCTAHRKVAVDYL